MTNNKNKLKYNSHLPEIKQYDYRRGEGKIFLRFLNYWISLTNTILPNVISEE